MSIKLKDKNYILNRLNNTYLKEKNIDRKVKKFGFGSLGWQGHHKQTIYTAGQHVFVYLMQRLLLYHQTPRNSILNIRSSDHHNTVQSSSPTGQTDCIRSSDSTRSTGPMTAVLLLLLLCCNHYTSILPIKFGFVPSSCEQCLNLALILS